MADLSPMERLAGMEALCSRALFDLIDEGVCLIERISDTAGGLRDYRYLTMNPAMRTMFDIADLTGQTIRANFPGEAEAWYDDYDRVLATGEPALIERRSEPQGMDLAMLVSRVDDGTGNKLLVIIRDNTVRSAAEAALRASEERQAFLLKLSDALRPIGDPGRIGARAMQVLADHLGVNRADFLKIDLSGAFAERVGGRADALPPLHVPFRLADFGDGPVQAYGKGTMLVVSDTADLQLSDAERQAYATYDTRAVVGVPVMKDGRCRGVLTVSHDRPRAWSDEDLAIISETAERIWTAEQRERAETAVRHSEARLTAVFESLPVGVAIVDSSGEFILRNSEMRRFAPGRQLHPDDADGQGRWRAWDETGTPIAPAAFPGARALQGIPTVPGLEMCYTDDVGNGIWTSVTAMPIRNEDGAIIGHVTVVSDINALKKSAASQRDSERRLQSLIEGMPQLVWRAQDDGKWTWASRQWTEFTGQSEIDSRGWGWLDPVHPDDRDMARRHWAEAEDKGALRVDHRLYHAAENSYRWFQTRALPVRDDAGRVVEWLGTSTDVDDLRRLQQHQQVLVAELQHRVRNILTVIRSVFVRTADTNRDRDALVRHFRGRLDALARTHVVVTRRAEGTAALQDLVREQLLSISVSDSPNVRFGGPEVELTARCAETVCLAIHELATNSIKYGALKHPDGSLEILWSRYNDMDGKERVELCWTERGVPMPAHGRRRRGFGQELIEDVLPYQLQAETKMAFEPDGLRCLIAFPLQPRSDT